MITSSGKKETTNRNTSVPNPIPSTKIPPSCVDAEKLLDGIGQCQICYMEFNEGGKSARAMHCGHTFCLDCIEKVYHHSESVYVACPTCRARTRCPIAQIAPNYLAMEMMRKLGLLSAEVSILPKTPGKGDEPSNHDTLIELELNNMMLQIKELMLDELEEMRSNEWEPSIVENKMRRTTESILTSVKNVLRPGQGDGPEDYDSAESMDSLSLSDSSEEVRKRGVLARLFRPFRRLIGRIRRFRFRRSEPEPDVVVVNPLRSPMESEESDNSEEFDESDETSEDDISSVSSIDFSDSD